MSAKKRGDEMTKTVNGKMMMSSEQIEKNEGLAKALHRIKEKGVDGVDGRRVRSLRMRGMIDEQNQLTDAGREFMDEYLPEAITNNQPEAKLSEVTDDTWRADAWKSARFVEREPLREGQVRQWGPYQLQVRTVKRDLLGVAYKSKLYVVEKDAFFEVTARELKLVEQTPLVATSFNLLDIKPNGNGNKMSKHTVQTLALAPIADSEPVLTIKQEDKARVVLRSVRGRLLGIVRESLPDGLRGLVDEVEQINEILDE